MANDHYIPQFYLRNFEIPGRTGWIYLYRRGRRPTALGIRSVASQPDYYTLKFPQVDIPPNAPDEFLKRAESAAAPIITNLLTASKLELSQGAAMILSKFVGFLAARTPMARQRALNIHLAMRKKLLKDLAEDPEEYEKIVAELNLAKTKEEAEVIRQGFLNVEESVVMSYEGDVDDFSLKKSFATGELLTTMLLQKYWVLVEAPPPLMFVTSDNPFVTLVPEPYIPGMEVSPINAECLLPLSPQRALLFSNKIKGNSLYKVSKERMSKWVKEIVSFGYENVFASVDSEYFQREFDRVPANEITKIPIDSLPNVLAMMKESDGG
jgi:hypothetical protein